MAENIESGAPQREVHLTQRIYQYIPKFLDVTASLVVLFFMSWSLYRCQSIFNSILYVWAVETILFYFVFHKHTKIVAVQLLLAVASVFVLTSCNLLTVFYLFFVRRDGTFMRELHLDLYISVTLWAFTLTTFWNFLLDKFYQNYTRKELSEMVFFLCLLIIFTFVFVIHFNASQFADESSKLVVDYCCPGLLRIEGQEIWMLH